MAQVHEYRLHKGNSIAEARLRAYLNGLIGDERRQVSSHSQTGALVYGLRLPVPHTTITSTHAVDALNASAPVCPCLTW